jgi:ATP-binding cassette subfamily B (MDR/TAP) protein 1
MGITLTCGNIIQKLATFVVAFTLAVVHSWSLTFVILATIPVIVFVQGCSQAFAQSPYNEERNASAAIATRIERAVASIVTVKAFSAVSFEVSSVKAVIDAGVLAYRRCCTVWAIAFGTVNFLSYTMFVQGFWYGALLVHRGKLSVGSVAGVFWACLIAGTNLQMIMPMLIPLQKAKTAMVSLEMTIKPPPSDSSLSREELPSYDESVFTAKTASSATQSKPSEFGAVAKSTEPLRPPHCTGTFEIPSGLTFSYAARADARPALNITTPIHVAQELLFFVGGSGSGKSTLAQILLGMYQVQRGHIYMDDIPLERLDKAWIREHVALVSQECLVFDMSIHDNVALGRLALHPAEQSVSREEIERACRVAMVHDFVHDLPDGYDTMLGSGGANLSGGQKQRVALARAVLRDPSVLILGTFRVLILSLCV